MTNEGALVREGNTARPENESILSKDQTGLALGRRLIYPMLMPYNERTVPHCVVEVNQACNITCRACYKDRHGKMKPIETIKAEIDLLLEKRALSAISIAGGEPTLHPQLPEVIRYIVKKGLIAQMLSNGLSISDEMLKSYKEAGLSTIYLHIDSQQNRPDLPKSARESDCNELRMTIANKVHRAGIFCSLNVTLYHDSLHELPGIVDFLMNNTLYHRLLVTCCTDFDGLIERYSRNKEVGLSERTTGSNSLFGQEVTLGEVAPLLFETRKMEPFGYIASNKSLSEKKWLFYFAFTIGFPDGRTRNLHVSARFKYFLLFAQWMSMRLRGRYPSGRVTNGAKAVFACVVYMLMCLDLRTILEALTFLSRLFLPGTKIFQKSFIFQGGPTLTKDGEIEYCQNCPDATVRNGVVVPLCTADYLDSLTANSSTFLYRDRTKSESGHGNPGEMNEKG